MKIKNELITLTLRQAVYQKIDEMLGKNPSTPFLISMVKKGSKRTLSANAQQHVWYAQIAKAKGDITALEVKNMCKDMFGLPILHNSDSYGDKIEFLLHKLDYYQHSQENKMKLIQCLSVTSEFTPAESKEYMDNMIFYWNDQGINIKYQD